MTNVRSDTASEEVVGQAADGGMRTGNVAINGKSHFGATSPFGGTKASGPGRRNGVEGFREYLNGKTIGLPG